MLHHMKLKLGASIFVAMSIFSLHAVTSDNVQKFDVTIFESFKKWTNEYANKQNKKSNAAFVVDLGKILHDLKHFTICSDSSKVTPVFKQMVLYLQQEIQKMYDILSQYKKAN